MENQGFMVPRTDMGQNQEGDLCFPQCPRAQPLSSFRTCGVPGYSSWACWMGVWGGLHLPAMGTEFWWDLCPLSSRKELSHEEAPRRRSRKSRAVSRRTSPITPSAFWSESEWSSASPPAECMWGTRLVSSLSGPSFNTQSFRNLCPQGSKNS